MNGNVSSVGPPVCPSGPSVYVLAAEWEPNVPAFRMAARNSIIELEQLRNFPFDPSFFSLCVSGEWDLLYSTSRIATPDPAVKIRSIKASIDGDNMKLTHSIEWEFREEADEDKGLPVKETRGVFDVKMKYNFSEVPSVPTRMMIEIEVCESFHPLLILGPYLHLPRYSSLSIHPSTHPPIHPPSTRLLSDISSLTSLTLSAPPSRLLSDLSSLTSLYSLRTSFLSSL